MSEKASEWFGMRVTPSQKEKVERLAEHKGLTQKEAVMDAIERELTENGDVRVQSESALDQISELVGGEADSDVPSDLSTNPEHMEDYGRD